jgi:hypothetical protein
MIRRKSKITLWLCLAAGAIALALPALAHASINVVPNPSFEQGGCGGNTTVICGWGFQSSANTFMSQDTYNAHSGTASMLLGWGGTAGEGGGVDAETDPAFCSAIGPGAHPASFWYGNAYTGDDGGVWNVYMTADFFPGADCSGTPSSGGSLSDDPMGNTVWKQVSGDLVAPPGTQSVLFSVGLEASCTSGSGYDSCWVSANFDDLDVEDAVVTTPAIASLTPTQGTVGTSVDILGANFTGATAVTFNGIAAAFTVDSDSEIHATVPSGATTGPISVTTPQGTGTSNATFILDAPWLSSYTPNSGPAGTSVDIHGVYFTGATSVKFNGAAALYTVDSDWEIHATVPSGATTGRITVTTPSGTGSSSDVFTVTSPPPTVSSFTPTSGPVGTSVSIAGSGFTGASSVTFNGAASYTVNSPASITATVPSGATTGPIAVTTPYGTGTSAGSFTVILPPTITSFTPSSGSTGTNVTITGSNFTGVSKVKLGKVVAAFTVNSPTSITATVPTIAHGSYRWSVTNPAGTATSTGSPRPPASPRRGRPEARSSSSWRASPFRSAMTRSRIPRVSTGRR